MRLKAILAKLIPKWMQPSGHDNTSIASMVLLLRQPHLFSEEELRRAAERAWGISFAGGEESKHFVLQSGHVILLKAGPHLLSLLNVPKPYLNDPSKIAKRWPKPSQQQAWGEHVAFAAVDYSGRSTDVELEYCVLAKLVAEMVDANCIGVYVPGEHSFIPSNEQLYSELQKIAASRDPGVSAR